MKRTFLAALSTLLVLCLAASTLNAAPILVNCGRGGSIGATLSGLAQAGNTRGITIYVKGTCRENIVIGAFDHLVLQASPIATLQDASNGTSAVVSIFGSYDVELLNFTINGGAAGVNCGGNSSCFLGFDTIQQVAGNGVRFGFSHGNLQSNNILNNAGHGVVLQSNSQVLADSNQITNNGAAGIAVFGGSFLFTSDIIQNNSVGIRAIDNSVVRAASLSISGNRSDGVRLESGSAASFEGGNTVTGNAGNGVAVHDLAFASFASDGGDNVSGNQGQPDVACYPQFSATRGAGGVGGSTNCNEPGSPAKK